MAGFSNDVVFGTNINLSGAETASMILDGELLIGNTGGNPQVATLTSPGTSLTIINGSGTIGVDINPPVSVANGGTGAVSLTDNAVLVGSGTNPITAITVGTNGQILLGSTAADPVFATATSSDNLLTLTLGAGSLDIVAQDAVAAAIVLTDNAVVRGDGGGQDVQTSTMLVSDAGEMTNPSQPAFFARNNANQNNFTGAGTVYIVQYKNETFDIGGDYDGTSVFTAPVDGKYFFSATVQLISLASTATGTQINMVSSTINKRASVVNGANVRSGASNTLLLNGELFIDLDAADTCHVTTQVSGMPGDTVDLSSFTGNTFAGYLAF